jgi:predicted RNase H-like HicB family nuclease
MCVAAFIIAEPVWGSMFLAAFSLDLLCQRPYTLVGEQAMRLKVEFDREEDGRWIADIPEIPGVTVYGATKKESLAKVQRLALAVLAEEMEEQQKPTGYLTVKFVAA